MNQDTIKHIIEAALLAAARPLSLTDLLALFDAREAPGKQLVQGALDSLRQDYSNRGIQLAEVASGYRIQVRKEMTSQLTRLWEERPPRYTRALLETLALIAYRQPITRGEIEQVRGVAVSTNIVRTLLEREWIREVGHKDVPGKPAMFGTTREFLDYFGLRSLDELPSLAQLRDLDQDNIELDLGDPDAPPAEARAAGAMPESGTRAGDESASRMTGDPADDEAPASHALAAADAADDDPSVDLEASAETDGKTTAAVDAR